MPVPVHTNGEAVAIFQGRLNGLAYLDVLRPFPLTREEGESPGEDIVIDEPGIHGEKTHHQYDVSTIESHVGQLIKFGAQQLLFEKDHCTSSQGHQSTMTEITKHDGEEEGECNNRVQSRINLGVLRNTIGVDNGLEGFRELVGPDIGWRGLVGLNLVDDSRDREAGAVVHILKSRLDQSKRVCRAPRLSNERLSCLVVGEFVQGVVNSFFLLDDNHPSRERASNLRELRIKSALGSAEHIAHIAKSSVDLVDLITSQFAVLIDAIQRGTQRLGDLSNFGKDILAMSKDHKDTLVNLLVVDGVNDCLRNLRLVHVEVTAQGTPQDAFESTNAVLGDDTSNETDVHLLEALLAVVITVRTTGSVLFDITEKRSLVVIEGLANVFRLGVGLFLTLVSIRHEAVYAESRH